MEEAQHVASGEISWSGLKFVTLTGEPEQTQSISTWYVQGFMLKNSCPKIDAGAWILSQDQLAMQIKINFEHSYYYHSLFLLLKNSNSTVV